jgi:8-oxo-dGTP pyrophosphatase MutT (NUDIX family)
MSIKFNNRPNPHVINKVFEGNKYVVNHDYFISRSVAVVGVVFVIPLIGSMHVLITQRSNKMRDEANKFGVPCGYLDWDESGYEAMVREVYEETSLYLPEYKDLLITNNNEKPMYIQDNPNKDLRQNVSLIYLSVYDFTKNMDRFPTGVEKYSDKETANVKWLSLVDFYAKSNEMEWAFHHDETINDALKKYNDIVKS